MVGSWCRYKNAPENTVRITHVRGNDGGTGAVHKNAPENTVRITHVRGNDGGTGAVDRTVAEPCTCPECQDIRRRLERTPR